MSEESEDEKKFRVVDVQPEDLERADQRAGRSSWGGGDVWPGSASPADSQLRVSDGDDWQTITITTTTTVHVNRRGEVRSSAGPRGPRSAWVANDRWPGSAAPTGNGGRGGGSAWVADDRWPGSAAPTGNGGRGGGSAWVQNDRWPGSSAPATNKGDDPDQAE